MYTEQQIKEIKEYAAKHVCTHYAVNADIDKHPKIYDRSEGVYVYDIHGTRYLDTFGSLLTTICGHNNQAIMDAMNEQFKKIDFFPNFGDDYCMPAIELAKRLVDESQVKKSKDDFGYDFDQSFDPAIKKEKPVQHAIMVKASESDDSGLVG